MFWNAPELVFPPDVAEEKLEMGIDETGRGAVLGDMVYCGAFAPSRFRWPTSVTDSKQLTPERRVSILESIKSLPVGFVVRVVSAAEISSAMFSQSNTSLNSLSHKTARHLVQTVLGAGLHVESLYVDTVGDAVFYEKFLRRAFPTIESIVVCERADSKFKVVGAASINAKVLRDRLLQTIKIEEPNLSVTREFGSGYPSDAATAVWLEQNFDPVFGYPSIARFSWTPVADAFKKHNATADFDGNPERRPPIDSSYFTERSLRAAQLP
jgi:ribonuclease H2 subunit A